MEDKNTENRQTRKFKVDFSNALIILIGVAMLSVIIYAFILRISSPTEDPNTPNQLNGQLSGTDQEEIVTSGPGYTVFRRNGQFYLNITDGSKISDINALLRSLDLPSNTEVINPAAGYARPINPSQEPVDSDHEDTDFDPINPNQPEQPKPNPNE